MSLDINSTCRLCADICNPENDHLFSKLNDRFVELIHKYLSIKITVEDFLPVHVCETCRSKITSFDDYVLQCSTTQLTLSSLFIANVKCDVNSDDDLKEELNIKIESQDHNIKSEDEDFCNEDLYPLSKSISQKRKSKKDVAKKRKKTKTKVHKVINEPVIDTKPSDVKQECKDDSSLEISAKNKNISEINRSFFKFVCHICKNVFPVWSKLKHHVADEHFTKAKVLCICDKYLSNLKSMYVHMMKHDSKIGIQCKQCSRKFLCEKYYNQHIKTHTSKEENKNKCRKCPKIFANQYVARIHEKTHIPVELRSIFTCDLCEATFTTKQGAMHHKRVIHEKLKPYMCDVCGKNFGNQGALNAHRVYHNTEGTFCCPQCPKKFKTKRNLKRHVDYHNGVTFKCPECPSVFNYKKTLDEHMFVHANVYRFICGYCNKGFKWKASFQSHINNHTGETPFSCPWCPKTFPDGSNCRIHKRRKHPLELAKFEAEQLPLKEKIKRSKTSTVISLPAKDLSKFKPVVFPSLSNFPNKIENNTGNDSNGDSE